MRHLSLGILISAMVIGFGPAEAFGNDSAHGGGGIVRNGEYLTFGSAKVRVRPQRLNEMPGLQLLTSVIVKMPLDDEGRGRVLGAMYPSNDRLYFRIEQGDLDKNAKSEFVEHYFNAVNKQVPKSDLVVFSYTIGRETYLLPEFFTLTPIRQAAILFHEGLWVINSELSYRDVIDAEIQFEHYLTNAGPNFGYDVMVFAIFQRLFNDPVLGIIAAAKDDMKNGRLAGLLNSDGGISLSTLFGHEAFVADFYSRLVPASQPAIVGHIQTMIAQYPHVATFQALFSARRCIHVESRGNGRRGFTDKYLNDANSGVASVKLWELQTAYGKQTRSFWLYNVADENSSYGKEPNSYLSFCVPGR